MLVEVGPEMVNLGPNVARFVSHAATPPNPWAMFRHVCSALRRLNQIGNHNVPMYVFRMPTHVRALPPPFKRRILAGHKLRASHARNGPNATGDFAPCVLPRRAALPTVWLMFVLVFVLVWAP